MNCDCMIVYLRKFAKVDTTCDGVIDLKEFCTYLNLPPTKEVKTIFRIYDIVSFLLFNYLFEPLFNFKPSQFYIFYWQDIVY